MTTSATSSSAVEARRTLAVTIWTALALMAVFVLSRGFSGALTQPLPGAWLWIWCLGGAALSYWAGTCLESPNRSSRNLWLSWAVALLFGSAWWPTLTPFQAGLIAGVFVLNGGLIAARGFADALLQQAASDASPPLRCEPAAERCAPIDDWRQAANASADDAEKLSESAADDNAEQRMVRRIEGDVEICEGHQRITFAEGQREATVHIALCPPLPMAPQVELDDSDGLGWDLKVAAAYPYGIRIAVRRPIKQTAAQTGRVAWWASAPTSGRSAA